MLPCLPQHRKDPKGRAGLVLRHQEVTSRVKGWVLSPTVAAASALERSPPGPRSLRQAVVGNVSNLLVPVHSWSLHVQPKPLRQWAGPHHMHACTHPMGLQCSRGRQGGRPALAYSGTLFLSHTHTQRWGAGPLRAELCP